MPGGGAGLGIDFGTSNTVAVLRLADGRRQSLLFDGSPMLPSAVYAESAATLLTGRDALYSARLDPSRFEPNPKRRIDDGLVLLGEAELPATTLVAAVLERVATEASRTVGYALDDVVLTYPAGWGASRRLLLADAAEQAGLGAVRLIPEPVAAAMYFVRVLEQKVPVGSGVLVHDFGAGTFDASVVRRTETGFETVAVDGRDDTGGLDVDAAIVEHLGAVFAGEAWDRIRSPRTTSDRRHRRTLWEDVRLAKERLSRHSSAGIVLPGVDDEAVLTRDELDALAKPLVDRTVRMTQSVLRFSRLDDAQLAGVFLVGGGSRMPLVTTMLHRSLSIAPTVLEQPELVVAEGALAERAEAPPAAPAVEPAVTLAVARPVPAAPRPRPPVDEPTPIVEGRARVSTPPAAAPNAPAAPADEAPAESPRPPKAQARRRIRLAHAVLWPTLAIAAVAGGWLADWLWLTTYERSGSWGWLGSTATWNLTNPLPLLIAGAVAAAVLRVDRKRLGVLAAGAVLVVAFGALPQILAADDGWSASSPVWSITHAVLGVALGLGWLVIRGRRGRLLWAALASGIVALLVNQWLFSFVQQPVVQWALERGWVAYYLVNTLYWAAVVAVSAWLAAASARRGRAEGASVRVGGRPD